MNENKRGWNSKRLCPTSPPLCSTLPCRSRSCPVSSARIYYSLSSAGALRQSRVTWGYSPELSSHPNCAWSIPAKNLQSQRGKKQQQDITLSNSAPCAPHPTKYLTASPPSHACVWEPGEMGKGRSVSLTLEAAEFLFLPPFLLLTSRDDGKLAEASRWPYGPWREDRSNVPPRTPPINLTHAHPSMHASQPFISGPPLQRWKAILQGLRQEGARKGGEKKWRIRDRKRECKSRPVQKEF